MKKPARERILETADQLFARRGYGNVGINEIIDRSGTAKATFYQHFPSKESLCSAWLTRRHDRSEAEWQRMRESAGQPEAKILALFDQLEGFLEAGDFRGCPYTNTAGFLPEQDGEVREMITAHKDSQRDLFISLVKELTTPARARKLGTALFLLYSGAAMESQNARDCWPVTAAREGARILLKASNRSA